jgi:hypothetical protein
MQTTLVTTRLNANRRAAPVLATVGLAMTVSIASARAEIPLYFEDFDGGTFSDYYSDIGATPINPYGAGTIVNQGGYTLANNSVAGRWQGKRPSIPANDAISTQRGTIDTAVGNTGSSLKIDMGSSATQIAYWSDFSTNTDMFQQDNVRVSFDIKRSTYTNTPVQGSSVAAFYGVGLFGSPANNPNIFNWAFRFGVTEGSTPNSVRLAYVNPTSGTIGVDEGVVPIDQWTTITAVANFNTFEMTFEINGAPVLIGGVPFTADFENPYELITELNVQTIGATNPSAVDFAHLDNLSVTIPEPTTLGVIAAASALVLRRRR